MALFKGVGPYLVDHFVQHLPYIAVEKELGVMSEDVDLTLVMSRLLF